MSKNEKTENDKNSILEQIKQEEKKMRLCEQQYYKCAGVVEHLKEKLKSEGENDAKREL